MLIQRCHMCTSFPYFKRSAFLKYRNPDMTRAPNIIRATYWDHIFSTPIKFWSKTKGYVNEDTMMGPINVRGTTPGKIWWSYFSNSGPWYKMSWIAWRLKLSSTLVNGQINKWAIAVKYNIQSFWKSSSNNLHTTFMFGESGYDYEMKLYLELIWCICVILDGF